MPDRADSVVVDFRRKGTEAEAAKYEDLRHALTQLDELSYRLQQFSPQPHWSTQRWMIDSTPFRMRLGRARSGLSELAKVNSDSGQGAIRWAIKFNNIRFEAERRLDDIDECLYRLLRSDASTAERALEAAVFAVSRSEFLRALEKVNSLVGERFDTR